MTMRQLQMWSTAVFLLAVSGSVLAVAQSPSPVPLGLAGEFAILTQSGITNVPTSAVKGDVGTSPITGAADLLTCSQVVGTIYSVDAAGPAPCSVKDPSLLTTAVANMVTAYNNAAGRLFPNFLNLGNGDIGGLTLTPGLYRWTSTVSIPTDVFISGSASDVWIFQITGSLLQSNGVAIHLERGAKAQNIFWQVAGATTIGTTAKFEGILLGKTVIAVQTGASVNGRLLSQTAVTLEKNAVTQP